MSEPRRPMSDDRSQAEDRRRTMLEEVRAGLSDRPRTLPSKYLYDSRGSKLFERITALPEYYLTDAERRLLKETMADWIGALRPRTLVELGAGSAAKTRIILDAMVGAVADPAYHPVDVSADFLEATAGELRREYPDLRVEPVVADFTRGIDLPAAPPRPVLFAFLGSTIGNFVASEAAALIGRIRRVMGPDDRFLLGVDLRKDRARLEAAYNDPGGVTAAFNRNLLDVINRGLGSDFDPDAFEHRAAYDSEAHCIEMHLVSARDQRVDVPGLGTIEIRRGEAIRTEVSCKYDRPSVESLFGEAGLRLDRWYTGSERLFGLALGVPV